MGKTETFSKPDYFELLYEAHAASEAVDMFDLHSDDPVSVKEWERLCSESADAQCELVAYCERNGRKLKALLAC